MITGISCVLVLARAALHITAWSGTPPGRRRLRHLYWYLGIEVEPSCVEKEFVL